jgi:hypothetical protein
MDAEQRTKCVSIHPNHLPSYPASAMNMGDLKKGKKRRHLGVEWEGKQGNEPGETKNKDKERNIG